MDRRSNNIAIFQDSMDLIKANQKLQQAVQFSIQNQKLYVPSQAITLPEPGKSPCKTIVSSKRSFESASAYAKAGKQACVDRKSTRLNSSHWNKSRMPSSA